MTTRFLLTAVTGLRNRGVEALVQTTIEQLSYYVPDCHVTVLTRDSQFDRTRLTGPQVTVVEEPFLSYQKDRLRRPLLHLRRLPALGARVPALRRAATLARTADIVIASGGDMFTSDYGATQELETLRIALDANTPVVLLAQSIGPFATQEEADNFSAVARRTALVTVRERASYNYCVNELNLPEEKVVLTADSAFLLNGDVAGLQSLRRFYGVGQGKPVAALGISEAISRYSGSDYERHVAAWRAVIEMLTDELGLRVVLVPHVQERRPQNDDRILSTRLLRELSYRPDVTACDGDHTASEYKGLIGGCDLVVGERMHSCIAGLSSGVPTVAVGYSVKSSGIMSDFFGEGATEAGLLISIDAFLDPDHACEAVRKAWDGREQTAAVLKERIPVMQALARKNFELIAQLSPMADEGRELASATSA